MAVQRDKVVSYRRAEWVVNAAIPNLEKCVRQALEKLKTIDERTINRGSQRAKCAKYGPTATAGIYLHLTAETPGEATSVVPKVESQATELDVTTENPPAYGEWLDGDAFLFIQGNHVCMCATAVRDQAVGELLRQLILKAKLPENYTKFLLIKAADISKLKMLHKQGVKELEIRASLYKATADYTRRKAHAIGAIGALGKHLKAVLQKPHDATNDSLRVFLTIKTDGRAKKALPLGEKHIEALAADVVKQAKIEGDDYVIITKTGQKISPDEIFVKTTVSIDANGKTVDRSKAWKELYSFYNQLKTSGIFEQ